MDWVITVPKTTKWKDCLQGIDDAQADDSVVNYHVSYFPKYMEIGDRIFVVWNGFVRGWMLLIDMVYREGFVCASTNRCWPEGKYLVRSGPFHVVDGPPMRCFRGIRKMPENTF